MERPRRRLLANSDRVSTTYEITSEKRLAQNDVTHLIKAHHRRPQRGHVGFVGSAFLPTPPFQVVIDDVAVVGKFAGEEVPKAQPHRFMNQSSPITEESSSISTSHFEQAGRRCFSNRSLKASFHSSRRSHFITP